jgi:hypothetical protein
MTIIKKSMIFLMMLAVANYTVSAQKSSSPLKIPSRDRSNSLTSSEGVSSFKSSLFVSRPVKPIMHEEKTFVPSPKEAIDILLPLVNRLREEITTSGHALPHAEILPLLYPDQNPDKRPRPYTSFQDLLDFIANRKMVYKKLSDNEATLALAIEAVINDDKMQQSIGRPLIESTSGVASLVNFAAQAVKAQITPGCSNLHKLFIERQENGLTAYQTLAKECLAPEIEERKGQHVEQNLFTKLQLVIGAKHIVKIATEGNICRYTSKKKSEDEEKIQLFCVPEEAQKWINSLTPENPEILRELFIRDPKKDLPASDLSEYEGTDEHADETTVDTQES